MDNIGEFVLHGDNRKINVTTPLQTFAMFVTAEPHYLVKSPSRFVVLETVRPSNNLTDQMLRVSTIKYRGFEAGNSGTVISNMACISTFDSPTESPPIA